MSNNSLAIVFLMAGTLLSTTAVTIVPAAYAGGRDDGDNENKQKVEDGSAAAIADCDWNDVEEADLECVASAGSEESVTGDNGRPTPEPEPEPETATLTVCREGFIFLLTHEYSVIGNNPSPSEFELVRGQCVDITIGPGMYLVVGPNIQPQLTGDCTRDPSDIDNAVGEIQSGETQTCTFFYPPF